MPSEAEQLIQSELAVTQEKQEKEEQQKKVMEIVAARNYDHENFMNKYNFVSTSQLAECIMFLSVERNSIRVIEGEQAYKLVEIVIAILEKRFDKSRERLVESTFKVEKMKQ